MPQHCTEVAGVLVHRFGLGKRRCHCGAECVADPVLRKYPRSEGLGLSGPQAAKAWGKYINNRDSRQTHAA